MARYCPQARTVTAALFTVRSPRRAWLRGLCPSGSCTPSPGAEEESVGECAALLALPLRPHFQPRAVH